MAKKLNTKDIKATGEGGLPKTLQPGNTICKINSVRLEEFKFKPGSYHIVLNLEGPELENFEGFFIDKNNEKLGKHKGQVADVKASEWAYADGTTKSGIEISRDDEMLKFLKNLCVSLEINNWLVSQNDKHETIESLFNAFNKEKPFAGQAMEFCIAGKEYTNKNGYTAYELFLPKFSKNGSPFGKNVVDFNAAEHIKKKKTETVSEFGSSDNTANSDFQLD